MSRQINIGITITVENPAAVSVFSNGICQNIVLLRELYTRCAGVANAYLINVASPAREAYGGTDWEPYREWFISLEEAHAKCDVVVACNGFLGEETCRRFRQDGRKLVKHVLGPELCIFNEKVLFGTSPAGIYPRRQYDAVWYSPHYERDRHFHEVRYDCAARPAAYIWDPRFLQHHIRQLQAKDPNYPGTYVSRGRTARRVAVMEPNINLVKTCTIPIVVAEKLQRRSPECLDRLYVFGGKSVMTNKDLVDFVKDLEVHRAKKCFFEARYPIVWTLKNYADTVLSHQNQNELNYLYLDAAWLGYPVVHNSPMMRELGWYYPENDAAEAARLLQWVALNFDQGERAADYLRRSREFAKRYAPDLAENVRCYEELIHRVVDA